MDRPEGDGKEAGSGRTYPKWHWVGADPDDDSSEGRFRLLLLALSREVLLAHGVDEDNLPPAVPERRSDGRAASDFADRAGTTPVMGSGTALDIGGTASLAIERAGGVVREALRGGAGTTGSTTVDRVLLAVARSRTGATTGALTRTVGAPASTVSTAVSRLAAEGLVERRPLPSDGRRQLAVATAAGQARAERVAARWRHVDEMLLAGLSLYERDELARLLRRASAALEDR